MDFTLNLHTKGHPLRGKLVLSKLEQQFIIAIEFLSFS